MEGGEIVEVPAAGAPLVGAPVAGVEGDHAPLGADDAPAPLPPTPPPAPAAEEAVPAAVEGDEPRVVPAAAAAAAAWWYEDRFNQGMIILSLVILAIIFVYDMGVHPTAWWGKIASMTGAQRVSACFLTVGDITSLCLIFSQTGYFRRLWAEEGGAGLTAVVPPLAGAINCGVWLAYGWVVDNMSVIMVNGTGVIVNLLYTLVFFLRSGRRNYTAALFFGAVAVATVIAIMDYFVMIRACGWEGPMAVGGSGAISGALLYFFRAAVTMIAAYHNRGADGFSAQTLASFANALLWFVYACVEGDVSMQISNGIGVGCFVLHATQLAFLKFKKPAEEETGGIHQRLLNLEQEP